ncbi:cupin-like domain-containing protein [Croceimicrobium hydrocarbonivorans]|uniref:Cupin-like domain-containing protein n=1 Tax=Croceimicrobium hydrocarbonivorans TaxID=2761580 RepID=A0A7H0VA07_9FLAO|nr:cupin-like domain-containing protein [Croceimicrobium hydrocarbonivorans]QNR22555.1 cupin-like domain-containing protein [Croceimicrobium hydrocarbonivorans]
MQLQAVDVVDDISPEEFYQKYVKTRIPVKLKNYSKNWEAREKWTYPFLKEIAGDHKVKLHGAWQDNGPTQIVMPHVKETTFGEYLDMLEGDVKSDLRIFLFNLFKLEPSLLNDFDFPPIMDGYLEDYPYMFFGCAGSDVRLHYDIDLSNVFITQFGGTKRITLFDQSQTKYLYKLPFTTHSAADLGNIDYEKYPALKLASGWQTDLLPGETLFMPSGIWHYIQYIDGSFSLSLRTLNPSRMGKLQGAYNVFVIRKLDEYFNKFYKNSWSDYKLKKAIERTNEIIDSRSAEYKD